MSTHRPTPRARPRACLTRGARAMFGRAASGAALAGYLCLSAAVLPVLAPLVLRRRLARGKELPDRWREKLGHASAPRPGGPLVWMHAVGLGEVLALRAVIAQLHARRPDVQVLITSTTRASAEVLAANMPPRCRHQFLPLDTPGAARRFLDHWRPDLAIWAEQDLWPGLVWRTARRGIPLALIGARMNARAYRARSRAAPLYRGLFARFALISAQDADTAAHLRRLGAGAVREDGSLKPAAPPLNADADALAALRAATRGRATWLVASSHEPDEALALEAHRARLADDAQALLILAPRDPSRRGQIAQACADAGLRAELRSTQPAPSGQARVYVADTFGELGLWYRLVDAAFIGGTTGEVEGHNPWEAAQLGAAIVHGPRVANFAADYAALHAAKAACQVADAATLVAALNAPGTADMAGRARDLAAHGMDRTGSLCDELCRLVPQPQRTPT